MPTIERFAVNDVERQRARALRREIAREVPEAFTAKHRMLAMGAQGMAALWKTRVKLLGDMIQPRTIVTHYPAGRRQAGIVRRLQHRHPGSVPVSSAHRWREASPDGLLGRRAAMTGSS